MNIKKIFPFLFVAYETCTYLSNNMYLPALPAISHDLNASHDMMGLTLTTWFLGSATMQLLLWPIADRFGRRVVLLSGGVIFVLACVVLSSSQVYFCWVQRSY